MKPVFTALILASAALPATALARDVGEPGTAGGALSAATMDPCMLTAAVQASYTSARNEDVYGIVRAKCGQPLRRHAAVDPAEVQAAADWSRWVGGLRERRHMQDAMYGLVQVASR